MSTKQVISVTKKSLLFTIASFLIVTTFRFFLGMPMNGKRTDNSTFLKGATKGKPGKVLTKWRKRPWFHRMLIRHSVFWPVVLLLLLFMVNRTMALIVYGFIAFPLGWYGFRKGRLVLFHPFAYTDTDGIRHQQWTLKNQYRKLIRRQPIPGLVTRKTRFDETLPKELQEAVAASLNLNEFRGKPPVLKVTRYRRKSIRNDR